MPEGILDGYAAFETIIISLNVGQESVLHSFRDINFEGFGFQQRQALTTRQHGTRNGISEVENTRLRWCETGSGTGHGIQSRGGVRDARHAVSELDVIERVDKTLRSVFEGN